MRYTPREMRAHEAHAHEAYAPETDEHCAIFTIKHLLPHRSTFSSTSLLSHEHLLPPTRICCLPRVPCFLLREHAAYTHLLNFATYSSHLPPSTRRNRCPLGYMVATRLAHDPTNSSNTQMPR
jgi:hypothetical protein